MLLLLCFVLCGLFILFVCDITCWWLSSDNAGRSVMLKDAILVPKPPPEIIIPPQKDPRVFDLLSVCATLFAHTYVHIPVQLSCGVCVCVCVCVCVLCTYAFDTYTRTTALLQETYLDEIFCPGKMSAQAVWRTLQVQHTILSADFFFLPHFLPFSLLILPLSSCSCMVC